jgi:hypothetical protein
MTQILMSHHEELIGFPRKTRGKAWLWIVLFILSMGTIISFLHLR